MVTPVLYLVRHASTEWTPLRRLLGSTDLPLSEKGRDEAMALRARLPGGGYEGVWSSQLQRAVETARLAWGEPKIDRRLREIDFGELEGARWDQLSPAQQALLADFDNFAAPGGETTRQLRERVLSFVEELPPGRHLVFTHGGVVRLLLSECGVTRFPGPCELTVIDWRRRWVTE